MSGMSPLKDQLVHNNLAHKVLYHLSGALQISNPLRGAIIDPDEPEVALIEVDPEGFRVTKAGAAFILANVPDEVLSHRERKIMRDMTRPAPTPASTKGTSVPTEPALVNPDPNLSIAGLF